MKLGFTSRILPWLIAVGTSASFALSPLCAQEVATPDQTYRKDMGEPRFDSNAVTRYQVNETNGNLYLYHHLMTLPNQRGLPLAISLTYNSKNSDAPHLLGKACWSLSLEKRLEVKTFYIVEDPGDWEEVQPGDLLSDPPDENFGDINGDIAGLITGAEQSLSDLNGDKTALETSQGVIDEQITALKEFCYDTGPDDLSKLQESLDTLVNDTIPGAEAQQQELEGLEFQWDELWAKPNCERDGWENFPDCYMPDEDWAIYQSLGGNEGFIYVGELADIISEVRKLNDDRVKLETDVYDLDRQISETPGIIGELQGDWDDLDILIKDLDPLITEADSYLTELLESQEYYGNFNGMQYQSRDGATLIDGEGDGFFILEDYYEPASNSLHVDINTDFSWDTSTVTFKDGRTYIFDSGSGSDGRILAARDRYGNTNSYYYTTISDKNCLSAVQDNVGRRVELTYDGDRISAIAVKYGDQTRTFALGYNDESNLTSITNPENQTTYFEYYPPEMYQPPAVFRARPIKISRHLLSKVIDARENTINFEYSSPTYSCARIWKDGVNEPPSRECTYYWLSNPKDGLHPNVLVTDSNGNTLTKYLTELRLDAPNGRMERTLITRIDDPYSEPTYYEFDEYYFNLTKTTDTNNLVHSMDYDEMGNLVRKIADPAGEAYESTFTYETMFNQVLTSADFNNHTKWNYYVANGSPAGYGSDGVLWKEIDAEGNETKHWYNQYGQRIKTEDPRGKITEFEYDNDWGFLSRIRKYTDNPSVYFDKTFTYDCFGNKLSETDFNGNLTEYSYDVMNRLTGETVHDGAAEYPATYYYDTVGNRTGMVNPRGVITQYGYDGYDRLITVTEALGLTEERSKHYGYDKEDNKNSETDFNGNTTTFTHDALNRLKRQIDPENKVTVYHYGGDGDSSTNGGTHQYDRSRDRYTSMVQFNKSYRGEEEYLTTQYSYDLLYRLEKVTDPKSCEKEYYYDPVGNKLWEEDANNNRTYFEYDKDNRLKKVTDPYTAYVEYWYDASGNKYRERDKNGHDTYYEYDAFNRLTKTTDAENGEAYALYDGMNKVAERDKNANWTAFSYNGRNLLTETHYAISSIVSHADYDGSGNKVSEIDPNGNVTHFVYNGLNQMTSKIQDYGTLNLETAYTYDDNGNRTSIEDAENNITYYEYDSLNRLIEVEDPINGENNTTDYDYDLLGNKVKTTDAKGNITEYFYDDISRLISTKNALAKVTAYEYDCVGNRISQIDAKSQEIEYSYDYLNRLKLRTFVGESSWVEYSYDSSGNRIWMEDSTGETSYTYDDINRLLSVTSPGPAGNKAVAYTYYANGERETMTVSDSGVTSYFYDDLNRLERILDPDDGETGYGYDYGSRFTCMTYPNGAVAHYDVYDGANRLIHLKSTDSTGNTTLTEFSYAYDKVGNRTDMIEASGTTHYDYDDLYRLTRVSYPNSPAVSYYYDAVGNRKDELCNGVTKDYNYNDLNQLISWSSGGTGTPTKLINVTGWVADSDLEMVTVNGVLASLNQQTFTAQGVKLTFGTNTLTATAWDSASNVSQHQIDISYQPNLASFVEYSYDANGCLQGKTVDGSTVTSYEYDFENRLTKVNLPGSLSNEFTYDGDKRRVASKNSAGAETWYLFDGLNVLQDLATDGTPWATYVQGIGIDKLISRKSSGNRVYYHCDAIGSARSLTNDAEFQVGTYVYNAWGKITLETGTSGNDYKFTSREWEDEIGLQFNRARFYDPETGRFTTPDFLTGGPDDPRISYFSGVYSSFHRFIKEYVDALQPDRHNRYVYCYNNPINLVDPLGLSADEEATADVQAEAQQAETGQKEGEKAGQAQGTGTEQAGQTAQDVAEERTGFDWDRSRPTVYRLKDRRDARERKKYEAEWENLSNHDKWECIQHNYDKALDSLNKKKRESKGNPVPITRSELMSIMILDVSEAKSRGYDTMGFIEYQIQLHGTADGTFLDYASTRFSINYQFGYVPPGIYKGSDINYYFQGFASSARGLTGYGNTPRIYGYNAIQSFTRLSLTDLKQIPKAIDWAKTGRDIYERYQEDIP
jgi:RHS repeat-associated protein